MALSFKQKKQKTKNKTVQSFHANAPNISEDRFIKVLTLQLGRLESLDSAPASDLIENTITDYARAQIKQPKKGYKNK